MAYSSLHHCGCWIPIRDQRGSAQRHYLPTLDIESHTQILSSTSRTTLKQTFVNSGKDLLEEVQYTFPLYDGVSVVGFNCQVAGKVLEGVVKEKQQARTEYKQAVERGETAGLLEQLPDASDVFTTKVGNVPAREKIFVEIVYLGELKHDAETDGSRFTVPTAIAPRYGFTTERSAGTLSAVDADVQNGIKFSVDVSLDSGTIVRGLQSPSHPIAVTMGRTASMAENAFENNHASAELTLGSTVLDKDFIIVVLSKDQGVPRALLETHPAIPNQRALMATLVPKFSIPNISPEIVFVVDRSGSMAGNIPTLVSALKIFLKSLPVNGVKFNICSFGSNHSFLFKKSKTYDESSLSAALQHVNTFAANFGGTEMFPPVQATCKNRYKDMPLEVMILTDGQIWNQQEMFDFIGDQKNARFFSLGIGDGASSALVEGIARAGQGFAQFVGDNEKMDKRVVRMLKGALTPHIEDYTLTVRYAEESADDDFEMIEASPSTQKPVIIDAVPPSKDGPIIRLQKKAISLFDSNAKEEPISTPGASRYDNLPTVPSPRIVQAPNRIPPLFAFHRTTIYLLLGPNSPQKTPTSVLLRGTSEHGPLELEIPVQDVSHGVSVHQLAAKKAVHELEQGRGWLTEIKLGDKLLKEKYEGRWDLIVERECVRLGTQFQVAGKYCSFIAVEKKDGRDKADSDFEIVAERSKPPPYAPLPTSQFSRSVDMRAASACYTPMIAYRSTNFTPKFAGLSSRSVSHKKRSSRGSLFGTAHPTAPPKPHFDSCYDPTIEDSSEASSATNLDFSSLSTAGMYGSSMFVAQQQHGSKFRSPVFRFSDHNVAPHRNSALADYQSRTMLLEQQNKKRLMLTQVSDVDAPSSQSPSGPPAPPGLMYSMSPAPASARAPRKHIGAVAPRKQLASKAARKSALSTGGVVAAAVMREEAEEECDENMIDYSDEESQPRRASLPRKLSDEEKMHKIIDLQGFDGSWSGSAKLWSLIGIDAKQTVKIAKGEDPKARATALAIAWLEVKMQMEEDTWEMVIEKARAWLENALGSAKMTAVLDEAKKFIAA